MKKITLLFSTTDRFASKFLRWAQRCEHSHVEVCFDGYVIGARSTGVKCYRDFPSVTHKKFRSVDVTDEQYEKFYKFMHDRVGEGYDWRAYLGFLIFKNTHSSDKWFCSEIVQAAFLHAGINVLENALPYYCMPRDFWISPPMEDVPTPSWLAE